MSSCYKTTAWVEIGTVLVDTLCCLKPHVQTETVHPSFSLQKTRKSGQVTIHRQQRISEGSLDPQAIKEPFVHFNRALRCIIRPNLIPRNVSRSATTQVQSSAIEPYVRPPLLRLVQPQNQRPSLCKQYRARTCTYMLLGSLCHQQTIRHSQQLQGTHPAVHRLAYYTFYSH